MITKTSEENILDLYHRYRNSGWRFRRLLYYGGPWGIAFTCAGIHVRIVVRQGRLIGQACAVDGSVVPPVDLGVDGNIKRGAYETLYRRLDKKAGVTRGK